MIYAYTTPEYPPHDGWTKIGYTDRQTVEERIKQQTHTVNIRAHLEWKQEARYTDGSEAYFTDHDFHDYLTRYKGVERRQKTEWFRIDGATSRDFVYRFAAKDYAEAREKDAGKSDYSLRAEQYGVVLAAGDGRLEADEDAQAKKSFDRVMEATRTHAKTITLSVGQLTTGVTVKPWTAVLMLSNMKIPSEYMQAAFRAQNPWEYIGADGRLYRKENAYLFDFAPERTLITYEKEDYRRRAAEHAQEQKIARAEAEKAMETAASPKEADRVQQELTERVRCAAAAFAKELAEKAQSTLEEQKKKTIEALETRQAEEKKKGIEDTVRAHLRGFARTIPSFIMAYSENAAGGGKELQLANFDAYTPVAVFHEVTGITVAQFRFLRDGGDYLDEATGENRHFDGHLFNEIVFDDAIQNFLDKKERLSDYFDESHDEDIFDYIPPQKTNQIFTPRAVVRRMVDALAEEDAGVFDDAEKTFVDFYMKSGLYITEIVKRLYRSEKLKAAFPDAEQRLRHILERQVFGFVPSQIIYDIAMAYIFGFDRKQQKLSRRNFVLADTAAAAKEGRLRALVEAHFGKPSLP